MILWKSRKKREEIRKNCKQGTWREWAIFVGNQKEHRKRIHISPKSGGKAELGSAVSIVDVCPNIFDHFRDFRVCFAELGDPFRGVENRCVISVLEFLADVFQG